MRNQSLFMAKMSLISTEYIIVQTHLISHPMKIVRLNGWTNFFLVFRLKEYKLIYSIKKVKEVKAI